MNNDRPAFVTLEGCHDHEEPALFRRRVARIFKLKVLAGAITDRLNPLQSNLRELSFLLCSFLAYLEIADAGPDRRL